MGVISQHSEGMEGQLKAIWEHGFGFSPIGIDDDFFELGGHSILAARILASLREIADRELPLSTLLYAPTIRSLPELARTAAWEALSWPGIAVTVVLVSGLPVGRGGADQRDRSRRHCREFRSYGDRGRSSRHSSDAIGRVCLRLKRQRDQGRGHVDMRLPPLLNQV